MARSPETARAHAVRHRHRTHTFQQADPLSAQDAPVIDPILVDGDEPSAFKDIEEAAFDPNFNGSISATGGDAAE